MTGDVRIAGVSLVKTGRRAVGRKPWETAAWRAEAGLRPSGACPVYTGRATEICQGDVMTSLDTETVMATVRETRSREQGVA